MNENYNPKQALKSLEFVYGYLMGLRISGTKMDEEVFHRLEVAMEQLDDGEDNEL